MNVKITKQQVAAILGESGPWTREQADEMAVKLIALRTIPNIKQVKSLGRFIWSGDITNSNAVIAARVNKLKV